MRIDDTARNNMYCANISTFKVYQTWPAKCKMQIYQDCIKFLVFKKQVSVVFPPKLTNCLRSSHRAGMCLYSSHFKPMFHDCIHFQNNWYKSSCGYFSFLLFDIVFVKLKRRFYFQCNYFSSKLWNSLPKVCVPHRNNEAFHVFNFNFSLFLRVGVGTFTSLR